MVSTVEPRCLRKLGLYCMTSHHNCYTGLRDLTVVADKARLAQKGLYDVDSLLININRTLADSHPLENQTGEILGLANVVTLNTSGCRF